MKDSLKNGIIGQDYGSFSRLYDEYAPLLLGMITRIVADEKQAEEVLINCFIKAWEQLQAFNRANSLFAWLNKIARKTAIEAVKAQGKNPAAQNSVYTEPNDQSCTFLSRNSEVPTAFELVYNNGLTCDEAAVLLNITVAGVRTSIREALKSGTGKKIYE